MQRLTHGDEDTKEQRQSDKAVGTFENGRLIHIHPRLLLLFVPLKINWVSFFFCICVTGQVRRIRDQGYEDTYRGRGEGGTWSPHKRKGGWKVRPHPIKTG